MLYKILETLFKNNNVKEQDILKLLYLENKQDINTIFSYADKIKKQYIKNYLIFRGLIYFSNICDNKCVYCGINKTNKTLKRYFIEKKEIISIVNNIAKNNINTVILQSGENKKLDIKWLSNIIKTIKKLYKYMAVTLCIGEKTFEEYELLKKSGTDRYLLKIETSNASLYNKHHPFMDFKIRLKCLEFLKELDYEVGTGIIVGLKNQTIKDLVKDILFLNNEQFTMLAIGPLIYKQVQINVENKNSLLLTFKIIAILRILLKNKHIPATTALNQSFNITDNRFQALKLGANVIMKDFTPIKYKKLYNIYD